VRTTIDDKPRDRQSTMPVPRRVAGNEPQTPAAFPSTSAQLRIAIISDAIAGRNGVGTYYPDLIRHLRPRVDSVQLYGPTEPRDRNLERLSLPMPGDRSQRLAWPNSRQLARRLDEQQPNLIVIPAIGPFSYFAVGYACRNHIPFVLVNHTNFDQLLSLYWPGMISKPMGWSLGKLYAWGMKKAAAVAAMDSESLDQARALGVKMVRVMGTPIPPEFIHTPTTKTGGTIATVTFVGRLATEKGLDAFLAAAEALPQIRFKVVGDGPLRNCIERAADVSSNIDYLGWLPRSRVLQEIDSTDMLILPSSVETFGTVALEALARRRYVLVRRQCGISKWPSIARGLFYVEADETIAQAVTRITAMSSGALDAQAARSWDAVTSFNNYTIRVWLRFLTDAAGIAHDESIDEFPV